MQDQIIKGTGNSRFLKSSIPENITFEQFVSLLRAGTFPIDFNGLNDAGIEQLGTPINKATLLRASTAGKLGFVDENNDNFANVTVDEALSELSKSAQLKSGTDSNVNIYSRVLNLDFPMPYVIYGTYVGTGTVGPSGATIINYGDAMNAKFIFIQDHTNAFYKMLANYGDTKGMTYNYRDSASVVTLTWNVDSVQLAASSSSSLAANQLNFQGTVYSYVVVGTKRI